MKNDLLVAVAVMLAVLAGCGSEPASPRTDPSHPLSRAGNGSTPDYVKVNDGGAAAMRSTPKGTSTVCEIPSGTKLEVLARQRIQQNPRLAVDWYKVEYNGKRGWVSEFVTTKW